MCEGPACRLAWSAHFFGVIQDGYISQFSASHAGSPWFKPRHSQNKQSNCQMWKTFLYLWLLTNIHSLPSPHSPPVLHFNSCNHLLICEWAIRSTKEQFSICYICAGIPGFNSSCSSYLCSFLLLLQNCVANTCPPGSYNWAVCTRRGKGMKSGFTCLLSAVWH